MVFQSSAFQPEPEPPERRRRRRKRRPLGHLKAAPFLSPLEQNAWQRGYTDVPGWAKRKPVLVQIATTIAGCGFGLTIGSTWWERGLFGASVATGVFLSGLVVLWLWHSATAPVRQRTEARVYARALEAHALDYAQWVRRRELAEDFRWNTMAEARVVEEAYDLRSDSELEDHWRTNLAAISAQMSALGADVSALIEANLAALDERSDGYGDRHRARIRNSMNTAAQNLHAEIRQEPDPVAPPPPKAGSDQ